MSLRPIDTGETTKKTKLKPLSLHSSVKDVLTTNLSDLIRGRVKVTVLDKQLLDFQDTCSMFDEELDSVKNIKGVQASVEHRLTSTIPEKESSTILMEQEGDTIVMKHDMGLSLGGNDGEIKEELIIVRSYMLSTHNSQVQLIGGIYSEVTRYLSLDQAKLFKNQLEKMSIQELNTVYNFFKCFNFVDTARAKTAFGLLINRKRNVFLLIVQVFNILELKQTKVFNNLLANVKDFNADIGIKE